MLRAASPYRERRARTESDDGRAGPTTGALNQPRSRRSNRPGACRRLSRPPHGVHPRWRPLGERDRPPATPTAVAAEVPDVHPLGPLALPGQSPNVGVSTLHGRPHGAVAAADPLSRVHARLRSSVGACRPSRQLRHTLTGRTWVRGRAQVPARRRALTRSARLLVRHPFTSAIDRHWHRARRPVSWGVDDQPVRGATDNGPLTRVPLRRCRTVVDLGLHTRHRMPVSLYRVHVAPGPDLGHDTARTSMDDHSGCAAHRWSQSASRRPCLFHVEQRTPSQSSTDLTAPMVSSLGDSVATQARAGTTHAERLADERSCR